MATKTPMTFGLFLPNRFASSNFVDGGDGDDATKKDNVPVMYWLSGLTCDGMYYYYFIGIMLLLFSLAYHTISILLNNITDTNFAQKAGPRAFQAAAKEGIAIVMPDTSPRGDPSVPNVDSYDLGIGAGFYVDATEEPYSTNYNMYTYITEELPALLESQFSIGKDGLRSISGHSMGGKFLCCLYSLNYFISDM